MSNPLAHAAPIVNLDHDTIDLEVEIMETFDQPIAMLDHVVDMAPSRNQRSARNAEGLNPLQELHMSCDFNPSQ